MQELIELIVESMPAALGFAAVILIAVLMLRAVLRKKFSILWAVVGCAYLGFLLAGTLRPERVQELFLWEKPWQWDVTFQLDLSEDISSLHGLFNVALFVPWGLLGMLIIKSRFAAPLCFLSCGAMTLFIETYQLFHRRSFDLGDVATNMIGCAVGIVLVLPILLYKRKRHKK